MGNLNLNALRAFVAVMQHGTLTEAARRIDRTQPTTTRLISMLEEDLRLELFIRSRQRLVPTKSAEAFYREALRVLATIDEIPRITEEIKSMDVSRIHVLTISRIAESLVCPAVAEFKKAHPSISVSIDVQSIIDLERWVLDQFDSLTLSALPLNRSDLNSQILFSAGLAAVVPKEHPLAGRRTIAPENLRDVPLVLLRQGTFLRRYVDRLFRDADIQPVIVAQSSSSQVVASMAAEGMGVALLDFFTPVDRLVDRISLVPIEAAETIDFGLVWRQDEQLSEDTSELLDEILRQVPLHRKRVLDVFGTKPRISLAKPSWR